MAIQLKGLSWLSAGIGQAIVGAVITLVAWIGKKTALIAAALISFAVLAAALVVATDVTISALVSAFPVSTTLGFFAPDDIAGTFSTYVAFRILYWAYSVNWQLVTTRLR